MSELETSLLHPIFYECVSSDGTLARPFSGGGYTYATDARILVRCAGEYAEMSKEWSSKSFAIFDDRMGRESEIPEIELEYGNCKTCSGAGKLEKIKCDVCNGLGKYPCPHCGKIGDCDVCYGYGYRNNCDGTCADCGGTGRVEVRRPIAVGLYYFRDDYLRRLIKHGINKIKIMPSVLGVTTGYFRGNGFDGIIVSMRP